MQRREVLKGEVVKIIHIEIGDTKMLERGQTVENSGAADHAWVAAVLFHVYEDVFFEDPLARGVEE